MSGRETAAAGPAADTGEIRRGSPRVVTSCRGRFHIFDQARELARHGALHRLITDYPRSWPGRFGVPPDKVHPLLFSGLLAHGLGKAQGLLPPRARGKAHRWIHDRFSRRLAGLIPDGTDLFIGLSSFCLEALEACRRRSIPCAVDHGSLHQADNRRLVREEAERWGVPMEGGIAADWVIEKEDREFEAADHVFVLSSSARDSMIRCGVRPGKIFVNPCGVDLSSFRPGKKPDAKFRVIQVGSISLGKGVLTLLDAFRRLSLAGAELLFVGGGFGQSGLERPAAAIGTRGVVFHPPVPQSELAEQYRRSSVFVLASVADGFGMVVPQAMACGLPVIVTENVGARDLVQDGVNGFVVPIGSPETIAERLRRLHDDPDLRAAMGRAARRTVESGYSWAEYGDRLFDWIQRRTGG